MKRWLCFFLFLLIMSWEICRGEVLYVARLLADAYSTEEFILVDDTSKIDELKSIEIISRDHQYRELHGIRHVYDGRSIYLTERLKRDFLSGATIFQTK